jgi:peptidoglycan/LPS O-acetylase OafA/YrhL
MKNNKLHYRPDIDGLRAVAILSVIFYHMDLTFMKGGFIGVDVFFVISGYLITSIIENNIERDIFTIKDFYFKRARRILPSFIVVVMTVLIVGFVILLNNEFILLGKSVTSGVLFWSNMWLNSQTGYFDKVSDLKPMLHLWSLAVEEQFYFIWPLLLMFMPKKHKATWLIILCIGSITYSLYCSAYHPGRAFYFLASRFWQMGAGGILAIAYKNQTTQQRWKLSARTLDYLSISGFCLIIASTMLFTKFQSYPSWRAILPTLGAVLLISAGPSALVNHKLLSHKAIVAIGLISYPLYLWHWPLLYFVRVASFMESTLFSRLIAVAISFVLAYFCTHYLEKYFRKIPTDSPRLIQLIKLHFLMGAIGLAASYFGNFNRISDSLNVGLNRNYKSNINKICLLPAVLRFEAQWCESDKRNPVQKIIIGDSHAGALFPSLLATSEKNESWQIIAKAGCAPHTPACKGFFQKTSAALTHHPEIKEVLIVFSSRLLDENSARFLSNEKDINHSSREEVLQTLSSFVSSLSPGRKIKFLIAPPALTSEPQFCLKRPFTLNDNSSYALKCILPKEQIEDSMQSYRELIKQLIRLHPEIIVIDPINIFCQTSTCSVVHDNLSYYSYADHISDISAIKISRLIRNSN